MTRNISQAARTGVYAQETSDVFIVLLTISHPSWADDVRVSSDPTQLLPVAGVRGTISGGEEYIHLPFQITLPAQDDTGVAKSTISIDNIGRDMMEKVREATSAIDVSFKIVLASQPDTVEMSVTDFKLNRVSYDAFKISGEISVEYFDLEPFPVQRFTPSKFQGVF